MLIKTLLLLLLTMPLFGQQKYYIDPAGDDGTGDGSSGTPWATLSHACTQATTAGDTVWLNAGLYTDNTAVTLAAGVHLIGAGKATTTVTSNIATYYIDATSGSYVSGNQTIKDFTLSGGADEDNRALDRGIRSMKRSDITITNMGFQYIECPANCTWGAIGIFGETPAGGAENTNEPTNYLTGISITNCTFTCTSRYQAGITSSAGSIQLGSLDGGTVNGCTFDESLSDGQCIRAQVGWLKGVTIYNNIFEVAPNAIARGQHLIMELWNCCEDTEIYNNTFTEGWISFISGQKLTGAYSLKFYNNKLINSGGIEASVDDLLIENNYFEGVHNGDYTYGKRIYVWFTHASAAADVSDVTIRHNVMYDFDALGILITDSNGPGTISNILIYGNILDGNDTAVWPYSGILLSSNVVGSTLSGIEIKNNILTNLDGHGTADGVQSSGTEQNNIKVPTITFNCFNSIGGSDTDVAGCDGEVVSDNISQDPLVVGAGNKPAPYYGLTAQSPCIDAGEDLGDTYKLILSRLSSWPSSVVTESQYGDGKWDIGAFRFPKWGTIF